MLAVTSSAKKKLKQSLKYEKTEDDTLIRIASAGVPSKIGFVLDTEKQEDIIINDEEGHKLLLVGPEMKNLVSDMVLDYKSIGDSGMQFTIRDKVN